MERFGIILKQKNVWLPGIITGLLSTLCFVLIGHTPIVRASGFALAIVGITLTLQRFGSILAIIAGMTLAFSPAFWSQTGGETTPPALISWLLVIAVMIVVLIVASGRKPSLGIGLGVVAFALFFWILVGTPRSLRITTIASAWLIYLMVDTLMIAHPRPGEVDSRSLQPYHFWGLLVLLGVSTVNEPLFVLLALPVGLALAAVKSHLPRLYWFIFMGIIAFGLRGFIIQYVDTGWWLFPAQEAESLGIRVPFIMADGWREASRWFYVVELISGQFSFAGLLLSIVGLARLSRWYPPIGGVTLVTFAVYALFGLVYFGRDNLVLLLPLLMIQMLWITYAIYALGEWLKKGAPHAKQGVGWLTAGAFALLPIMLLLRVLAQQSK